MLNVSCREWSLGFNGIRLNIFEIIYATVVVNTTLICFAKCMQYRVVAECVEITYNFEIL